MVELNPTWKYVLSRSYGPFFASLYGIYASKLYGRLMVVYKDDWCYWYVPKEYYDKHDENFCRNIVDRDYKRELNVTIGTYRKAVKNIENVIKKYENESQKRTRLTKQTILELLYDKKEFERFGKSMTKEDLSGFNTLFNNYGLILMYPHLVISDYPRRILADGIAQIRYGKKVKDLTRRVEKLNVDLDVSILTFYEGEKESPSVQYEIDLLRTFREVIRDNLFQLLSTEKDLLNSLSYDHMTRVVSQHYDEILDYETMSGVCSEIEDLIQGELSRYASSNKKKQYDQVIASSIDSLIRNHGWMHSGWEFGRKLEKEEILKRWTEWLFDGKILGTEIELAKLEEAFTVLKDKKETLINYLQQKAMKKRSNFRKEYMPYADIICFAGWLRHHRKNYAYWINHISSNLMKDVAYFCGLKDWKDIYFITIEEIIEVLRGTSAIDEKEIERRKTSCLLEVEDGKTKIHKLSGDKKVRSYLDALWREQKLDLHPYRIPDVKFPVRGMVVWSWSKPIEGSVRKIDNEQDLILTKHDDIVVAKMIEPYQGMLFKNCRGMIIEDENIASHAVHVAYSKGIPLIVGAQNIIWAINKHHAGRLVMFPDGTIDVTKTREEPME